LIATLRLVNTVNGPRLIIRGEETEYQLVQWPEERGQHRLEKNSATCIQKVQRGRMGRKRAREIRELNDIEVAAKQRLQKMALEKKRRSSAAVTLQASIKRGNARKRADKLRVIDEEDRRHKQLAWELEQMKAKKAVVVQSVWRGALGRRRFSRLALERRAAEMERQGIFECDVVVNGTRLYVRRIPAPTSSSVRGGDRAKRGSGGGEGACAISPAAGGVRGVSPRQGPRLPASAAVAHAFFALDSLAQQPASAAEGHSFVALAERACFRRRMIHAFFALATAGGAKAAARLPPPPLPPLSPFVCSRRYVEGRIQLGLSNVDDMIIKIEAVDHRMDRRAKITVGNNVVSKVVEEMEEDFLSQGDRMQGGLGPVKEALNLRGVFLRVVDKLTLFKSIEKNIFLLAFRKEGAASAAVQKEVANKKEAEELKRRQKARRVSGIL
jgi:hypothetical protein